MKWTMEKGCVGTNRAWLTQERKWSREIEKAEVVSIGYLTGFFANFDCLNNKTSIKVWNIKFWLIFIQKTKIYISWLFYVMKKCRRYGTDCEVGFLCTVFLYHHSICEKDPYKEQFSFFTHLNVKTMFISSKALFKIFCEKNFEMIFLRFLDWRWHLL